MNLQLKTKTQLYNNNFIRARDKLVTSNILMQPSVHRLKLEELLYKQNNWI